MSNDPQAKSKLKTATPKEPIQVPDLKAVVQTKAAERQAEVERLAGLSASPEPAKPAEEAKPRDFDAEIEALDPDLRSHYQQRVTSTYNEQINQQFGDIMPLIVEARNNPGLRKNLAALAKEEDLRAILADENAPKRLKMAANKKLSRLYEDEQFADFAISEALPVYDEHIGSRQPATPQKSAELERIEALEAKIDAERQAERDSQTRKSYVDNRIRERFALEAKYPVLRENQALREKVIGRAEQDFMERARVAGIAVDDSGNPNWVAQAIRAGIKPMDYMATYNDYASFSGPAASEAAPTGAVGDVRATQNAVHEPRSPASLDDRRLTKAQLRDRGIKALQNLKQLQQTGKG